MRIQLFIVLMSLTLSKANGQSQYPDSNFNGAGYLQTDSANSTRDVYPYADGSFLILSNLCLTKMECWTQLCFQRKTGI